MGLFRRFAIATLVVLSWYILASESALALEIRGQIRTDLPTLESRTVIIKKKPYKEFPDQIPSRSLEVSVAGGLKNAVVFLEGNLMDGNGSEKKTVSLDQVNYRFEPHVMLVRRGEPFLIRNSDSMAHDIRTFDDDAKMIFQFEMNSGQEPVEKVLSGEGVYTIRCGLHRWMYAFIISTSNSYTAVTDDEGKFVLNGVPPGNYQVRVWHESLGEDKVPLDLTESIHDFAYTFKST